MLHQLIVYPVEVKINNVIPEQPAKSILAYQRQNLRPDITNIHILTENVLSKKTLNQGNMYGF